MNQQTQEIETVTEPKISATYSLEDNKIRLYTENNQRVSTDLYKKLSEAGFKYAPMQKLFYAPMWTPAREALAIELAGEIENEDITLEQRAVERAERFEGYSAKRAKDAEQAADYSDKLSEPFKNGQPILIGHHSQRKAEKLRDNIQNQMKKAVKFYDQSNYWASRSEGVLANAACKSNPRTRINRIAGLEKDLRRQEKHVKHYTEVVPNPANAAHYQAWADHSKMRIQFERDMLKASGYEMPDFKAIGAARRSATTSKPIVNTPDVVVMDKDFYGDETKQKEVFHITKEQFKKISGRDHIAVRKYANFRYRVTMRLWLEDFGCEITKEKNRHSTVILFIKDQKRVEMPAKVEAV